MAQESLAPRGDDMVSGEILPDTFLNKLQLYIVNKHQLIM